MIIFMCYIKQFTVDEFDGLTGRLVPVITPYNGYNRNACLVVIPFLLSAKLQYLFILYKKKTAK